MYQRSNGRGRLPQIPRPSSPFEIEVPRWAPIPSGPVGDTIARVTKAFGIQPCDSCERRRQMLNQFLAIKRRAR